MREQYTAAVLSEVGQCYGEFGRVSVTVSVVVGPKVLVGREFEATVDPWRARELARKLLEEADRAEVVARNYGHMPRRGELDRIAMGM